MVDPLAVPAESVIVSAGRTGMLTRTGAGSGSAYRWTRYADGATTVLPVRSYRGSPGSDVVVTQAGAVFTLTDMGGAGEPVVIDTSAFNTDVTPYRLQQVVGATLVMSATVDGVRQDHLVSLEGGEVVDRKVAVPGGHVVLRDYVAGLGALAVVHRASGSSSRFLSVVDLATGALTETYGLKPTTDVESLTVTPSHVVWVENPYSVGSRMVVVPRGTDQALGVPLEHAGYADGTVLRAIGDWVAYTKPGGGGALHPDPLHRVGVRSVRTGESFPLLDHATSVVPDADGGLLALGGTVGRGEGLYRIALDEVTGKPVATLLRTAGQPTVLTVVKETLPPAGAFDFDRAGGGLTAGWTLSRFNAKVALTLRHTASGRTVKIGDGTPREGVTAFPLVWDGRYDDGLAAYNGAYTWTMTAAPANGIGPSIERKGAFALTRAPRPHDFDDNGSPDVLARDAYGHLRSYDVRQVWSLDAYEEPYEIEVGGGWNVYDRVLAAGNIGGTRNGDLVARDKTGVLWFYEGKGNAKAPFAPRTRIGGGWGVYHQIATGSDVTGDGRNDLLATDKSGILWLYPGTGNAKAPFAVRKRIGGGWGVYNQLTATGNLAGGPAGDLVARDKAGVLWLYLGKGDGTFAARTRIGGGWGAFTNLVGIGDVDGDGRNDLLAQGQNRDTYDTVMHLYRGTGQWKTPFAPAQTDNVEQRGWIGDLF
ncbi:FG-GAP-like repeat-containing protein [Streptomyces diastatochromogenes]|nr:FG-GAP-like repeat-containing protein [Streptomyces diastatochromogenes]